MDNASFGMGDRLMTVTGGIKVGTEYSVPMQLSEVELTRDGKNVAPCELRVSIPELTATELPAAASIAVSLQFSDEESFATATKIREISDSFAVMKGSAAGAEGIFLYFQLPRQCGRFCRVKAVGTAVGTTTKTLALDYMV